MGFLKKKSVTKLSGGDSILPPPTTKTMSPTALRAPLAAWAATITSKTSNVDCRDDTSSSARVKDSPHSRSRSDSDSALNQVKTEATQVRGHRKDDSLSSFVSGSTSSKAQTTQGSTSTKSQMPTTKLAVPQRPSGSAPANVVKGKGGQHAAKGRSNPKAPKQKKVVPSSKKYTNIKTRWTEEEFMSGSSIGSSDDSDDNSQGSDDSSTDDEGNTTIFEDSTMCTRESSFVSIGEVSTNSDDLDVSVESVTSGETSDFKEAGSHHHSEEILSPNIFNMLGKFGGFGGWKAKKEDGRSVAMGRDSLTAPQKDSGHSDFLKKMEAFTMKNPEHQLIVHVTEHGNIEKLSIHEVSYIPKPNRSTDMVIKVECSTINLQDCMIRRGKWYEMQKLPFIPGSDLVGTVHEIGSEASKFSTFQVGDRVAALVSSGGNAKYITVDYRDIIRVPPGVDSKRALSLSSTYVPARQALDLGRKMNTPFTGANILVIGGNGPSGLATIELALLEGANVFTTADARHHDFLTKLGATCFPIDPDKWLPTLAGKMDVVLDSVCLDGYMSSSLALNSAGILVCTGMSAVYTQGAVSALLMQDARDVKAIYFKTKVKFLWDNAVYYDRVGHFASAPNECAQHFRYLCHLASKGTIVPLVSTRAPLNKVASLQRAIELGDTAYGICVCEPWTT